MELSPEEEEEHRVPPHHGEDIQQEGADLLFKRVYHLELISDYCYKMCMQSQSCWRDELSSNKILARSLDGLFLNVAFTPSTTF